MKVIANFPAFDVVDLETETLNITAAMCDHFSGFRFCIAKQTMRHGVMYPEVSPNCVAYYCADDEGGAQAAIERAKANRHELYWFNNCASSLTSDNRPHYSMFLIKEGQKITMAGATLVVRIVGGHIRLDVVEDQAAA